MRAAPLLSQAQHPAARHTAAAARPMLPTDRLLARLLTPVCLLGALGTGLLAGRLGAGQHAASALLLPLLVLLPLLPVLLWHRPQAGVVFMFGAAVVVEQFSYEVGPRTGAVTAKIPLFHSITPGSGITPMEVLLGLLTVAWALRRFRDRRPLVIRTALSRRIAFMFAVAVLFLLYGLARHGNFKIALWEVRPYGYLALLYVLSASLVTTTRAVRALLWTLVLGSAAKAAYGISIWLSVRNLQPRPEAVLAHEESFFFGLYAFLVIGLWTFGVRGRLRTVSTILLPVVLFSDMCNSRRTAWAILITGALFMAVISYARVPERRHLLRRVGLAVLVIGAFYIPAFWNSDGTIAQPARAIRSVIAPDARDKASDQYRYLEDFNLSLNIQMSRSLGTGFGLPIDYAVPITDLRAQNSAISYIPHNGILYVWMRMGILGEIAFWLLIAEAMLIACRLAAVVDRETALLGALAGAAVVAYVIMGNKDLGLFWFRIAVTMGILLGAVEARYRAVKTTAGTRGGEADQGARPRLPLAVRG